MAGEAATFVLVALLRTQVTIATPASSVRLEAGVDRKSSRPHTTEGSNQGAIGFVFLLFQMEPNLRGNS